MKCIKDLVAVFVIGVCFEVCSGVEEASFTNSIGMKMVRIKGGAFQMGQAEGGDFDERPVHEVEIGHVRSLGAQEKRQLNVRYWRHYPVAAT